MGCNSSKSNDIQQGETERKRKPVSNAAESAQSPARTIGGRPGPISSNNYGPKSFTERRELENERFVSSLREEEQLSLMLKREEDKILQQATKSMFDLSQLGAPEPERKLGDLASSVLSETQIDPAELRLDQLEAFKLPGSRLNLIRDSDTILSTKVDEKQRVALSNYSAALSDAFRTMSVSNCGDLIESFPVLRKESPSN